MTQQEENKSNMYNAVEAVLKNSQSIIAEVPAFGEVHTDLISLIGEIKGKNSELIGATEGKTSVKSKAIEELITSVVPIASAVKAYATRNKLLELKATVDYSESKLRHLSHADIPVKIKSIKDAAQSVLAALANFGITEAKLNLVDAKLTALKSAVENKDVGFTDRSATREALTLLFDKADDLLQDEADELAEVLKETHLDFYNQYFAARKVKDLGSSHPKPDDELPSTPPAVS